MLLLCLGIAGSGLGIALCIGYFPTRNPKLVMLGVGYFLLSGIILSIRAALQKLRDLDRQEPP